MRFGPKQVAVLGSLAIVLACTCASLSACGDSTLPDVVGLDKRTAIDKLEALGLNVLVNEEPTEDASQLNHVLRQESESGSVIKPGTTVSIWVGVPTNTVVMPSVLGTSRVRAEYALKALGLVPKTTEVNSTLPGGTVLTQDPAAGTPVQVGSEVAIEVSNSSGRMVAVPSVAQVGLTLTEATNLLSKFHLKATVDYSESNSYPAGTVMAQTPAAGTVVLAGSTVALTVSK